MENSSDEEIYSDSEEIDLKVLWNTPPFIRMEEVEYSTSFSFIDEDYSSPKVIELLPISANGELNNDEEIRNIMNEINNMTRLVSKSGSINAGPQSSDYAYRLQVARQRILNFGNPSVIYEEPQIQSTNKNVSQVWPFSKPKLNPLPEDAIQYRYKQAQQGANVSARNWFCGKPCFSTAIPRFHNTKSKFKDENICQFILPTAISRREKRERDKKRIIRAEKAIFVTNLIFSSLAKANEHESVPKFKIFEKKKSKYQQNKINHGSTEPHP